MPSHRIPTTIKQNRKLNSLKTDKIYFTAITATFPVSVFLEWEILYNPILGNERVVYEFNVYRSESFDGEFDLLTTASTTDAFFLDESIDTFSILRPFYYKVIATSTNDPIIIGETINIETPVTSMIADVRGLQRRRFLEHQKIKRDRRIQLFMVNAELFLLKKKHTGERCPDCYDEITRESLQDKCPTCNGTTYIGGYYRPIRVLAEHSVEQVKKELTTQGYTEAVIFTATIQDIPRVTRDDLLYEPNNNRYYKVIAVQQTLLNKSPLTQILTVTELARDGIEYQIPFDRNNSLDLYKRVEINDVINSPLYMAVPL